MGTARTVTLALVSTAGGFAFSKYCEAVREIEAQPVVPPRLPGQIVDVPAPWGSCTYRIVEGDSVAAPLVLVHGWGRTADSAWWRVLARSSRTIISVDLPGYGRPALDTRFELDHAVSAIDLALDHSGYERAPLVGHLLGKAVALTAWHEKAGRSTQLVIIASAAYWIHPRFWVTLAAAPYVMVRRSPFLLRAQRRELRSGSEASLHAAWS